MAAFSIEPHCFRLEKCSGSYSCVLLRVDEQSGKLQRRRLVSDISGIRFFSEYLVIFLWFFSCGTGNIRPFLHHQWHYSWSCCRRSRRSGSCCWFEKYRFKPWGEGGNFQTSACRFFQGVIFFTVNTKWIFLKEDKNNCQKTQISSDSCSTSFFTVSI